MGVNVMKKFIYLLIVLFLLSGCSGNNNSSNNNNDSSNDTTNDTENNNQNSNNESNGNTSSDNIITNTFGDFTISSLIPNAYSKDGQTITFSKAGEYTVSGTFNGTLEFKVDSTESVTLYLNNANINSTNNHAIYWMNDTGKIEIKAVENTTNEIKVSEHTTNLFSAIESENNIEIGGSGKLSIKGYQRHAIKGSNIEIKGNVDLTIEALKDGLHGKQVLITGGNTKIINCTDAIQAEINSNKQKGTITVEEGILTINNCKRAFRADTSVTIKQLTGCTITINVNDVEELFECIKFDYVNGTFLVNGAAYK